MIRLTLRRFASSVLVMLVVSLLIFALLASAPGDAAEALIGESASRGQLEALREELALDLPLLPRYALYLKGLLFQGDLGSSLITGKPVTELLRQHFPPTLLLTAATTALAALLGLLLGTSAAINPEGGLDAFLMSLTTLGLAVPTYWSGLLLMLFLAPKLNLPIAGGRSVRHLLLPTLTLTPPLMAVVARLVRTQVREVLHAQHTFTAQAKGLSRWIILTKHVLRNSLIPIMHLLGVHIGHLLGGAFIVETIFGWPGMGRLTVRAIFDRDIPVVLGAALTISALYLLINFLVDVSHALLDPQVADKVV
jgi:ABC-type dipeptide/oligopeptide/nickel transport system permease component